MSRRLKALRVGNFKAFADTQTIPIKPITLVFGPNSAGKSSFIHSLALAHEAQLGRKKHGRSQLDVHHTTVGGTAIDLGGFRQFVHRKQFRNRVQWGAELKVSALGLDKHTQQLAQILAPVGAVFMTLELGIQLDKHDQPVYGAPPRIETVRIAADGEEILLMSRVDEVGTTLKIVDLNSRHTVFRQILQAIVETATTSYGIHEEDFGAVEEAISQLQSEMIVRVEKFFPVAVDLPRAEGIDLSLTSAFFPVSKGNRAEDLASAIRFWLPRRLHDLVKGLSDELTSELDCLQYLGPVRAVPPRHVVFQEHQDEDWESSGRFAYEWLKIDADVREMVNQWLGGHPGTDTADAAVDQMLDDQKKRQWMKTRYRLELVPLYSPLDLREPLVNAFLDRPLTLLERRQLLTKELVEVMSELQGQYEMKQSRIEEEMALLGPWIEQIQAAKSGEEREGLLEEALRSIAGTEIEGRTWEEIRVEQQVAQQPYDEAVEKAYEFVEALGGSSTLGIQELRLVDIDKKTSVSLRDVGVGISQVLPVLALAYGTAGKLIAIEQPEIHLHPALQAELGDLFIESALGFRKNTFILETHSEHLILRLMRRIREGKIKPDDVGVIFVEPLSKGSRFLELRIDEDGDFIDEWPGGFFEESFHEKFAGR
jgi:hypothetical protein